MDAHEYSEPMTPKRFALTVAEGRISGWRFAHDGAPPLLFAHANGYCASAYRQVLGPISAAYDVYAIDLRGHGRTTLPCDPATHKSWRIFAEDICDAINTLSLARKRTDKWTLAGHSMGAVSAMLAAAGRDDVREVRLIEPVLAPDFFGLATALPDRLWKSAMGRSPMVKGALQRRREWPDRAATFQSYSAKPPFSRWAPHVLSDYLQDGLTEIDDGVTLSCAPEWEAANYMTFANPVWASMKRFSGRLRLLVGAEGTTAPPWSQRRIERLGGVIETAKGCSHLAPMQDPACAVAFLSAN